MKHFALLYELQRYLRDEFESALPMDWDDVASAYIALNNDSMFEKLSAEYVLQRCGDELSGYIIAKKALKEYMQEEW